MFPFPLPHVSKHSSVRCCALLCSALGLAAAASCGHPYRGVSLHRLPLQPEELIIQLTRPTILSRLVGLLLCRSPLLYPTSISLGSCPPRRRLCCCELLT
ncbi:uncharacterized protein J3D65DRAFT_140862 [Phyllosticta citribraziliensis]|uniref:Secreted protein n=1 Tax=Phyllosticta citribraziliensis TaxID=989973 RepID=A0ABR1L6P5_9PEZI